ncbi:hypothetical protein A2567_00065 [Candidatus Azambacteria bacterium RIFOXYD1_FULL_42_11]|uniref:Uncharacterized protein n=1 Tax=Candidatus Azambacteria bacterium RIFOXYD1_FULL_42_11 TaxID=1797310 RepID=A0A1F5CGG6_9BACT|nr:MAG: hypothetical protein A2567_00065 [Candidatus Azambacteria bacterium RIFOXYD1_FULL_42_11]
MLISTRQAYFLALIFSSVLAWFSFFSIIFFVSPQSAGALGVVVLYASAAAGLISLSIVLYQVVKNSWQIIKLKKN